MTNSGENLPVPTGEGATLQHDKGDMMLRAKMADIIRPLVARNRQAEMALLERIDAAIEAAALATAGNGAQIRQAYLAGVAAFLREIA